MSKKNKEIKMPGPDKTKVSRFIKTKPADTGKSKIRDTGILGPARLDVKGLSVNYGNIIAINKLSFSIGHGQRAAVIGPNGAGKSTLFKALIGLMEPASGSIFIHGKPLGHHFDCVSYIPQREEVDWMFPVTVKDVVQMGRYTAGHKFKRRSKEDEYLINEAMAQMDIGPLSERPIGELSGGQQQRVFIARALAQGPHVLLMDEPFNGIDILTQDIIWALLEKLKKDNVTVLIATHDLNLASKKFDSVILLNKAIISAGPPEDVFSKENLLKAYGQQVMYLDNHAVVDSCCPKKIKD